MPRILGPVQCFVATITPWVVFVGLAIAMLFDPGRDSLGVAGASFAVAIALAAVSFSYARTLKEGSAVRDELVFAGERLVSGAVLFVVASILQYASNDVPRYADALFKAVPQADEPHVIIFDRNVFGLMFGVVALMYFLLGLICAQMGMVILISTARHHSKRRPDHNDYFVSGRVVEQRLLGLDQAERGMVPSDKAGG